MAILRFAEAFGGQAEDTGGFGDAATATAQQPMTFQPPPPPPLETAGAQAQPPQIMRFENAFQPQQPQAGSGDIAMGGSVQPLPPVTAGGVPAGQPRPAGQQASQQQPSGPSVLSQAGMANSMLQNAGRAGERLLPGLTRDIGGSGLNLTDISGPLNLAAGLSRGNVPQSIGGGLSTAATLARLADFPGVSAALGSLGGPLSLAMGIKNEDPMGIASGVLGTYGALSTLTGLAASAGILPAGLPSLGALASSALSSLGFGVGVGAPVAGGAAGLGAGVTAAGAGGAFGATTAAAGSGAAFGSLGAGATLGIAMAPIMAAYLGISISDMIQGPKDAKALEQKAKNTFARFPEQLANLQSSTGLLRALDTASPQQAAQIYDQLSNIMTGYRESGMENVLERGRIQSNTKTLGGPETISVPFKEAPALYKRITPYLQAITYGQLRAQDAAARGGVSVSKPRSAAEYAMDLGRTFAHDPKGNLESGLFPTYNDYLNTYYASPSQALTADLRDQIERNTPLGENPLHMAAVTPAETTWDPGAANVMAGFKPGSYEESLRALTGYESTNPFFAAAAKRAAQPTNWITTPSAGSTPHAWMTDPSKDPGQSGIGGEWAWDGNRNTWSRAAAPVSPALTQMRTARQASGVARTQAETAAAAADAPGAWADHSVQAAAAAAEAEAVRLHEASQAAVNQQQMGYNPPAP